MKFLDSVYQGLGYAALALLTGFCLFLVEKFKDWRKSKRKHMIFSFNVKDELVNDILVELRAYFLADRAYLVLFHDGTSFMDESADLKKSRTHERVAPGTSYEAQNYQDIRLSLMSEETELVKKGKPIFESRDKLKDGKFRRLLESQGVQAIARCPITSGKDVVGFIGLDWGDKRKAPENLQDMESFAGRIDSVLSRFRKL